MRNAAQVRELPLELLHFGSEDERTGAQNALEGTPQLAVQRSMQARQVGDWNARHENRQDVACSRATRTQPEPVAYLDRPGSGPGGTRYGSRSI